MSDVVKQTQLVFLVDVNKNNYDSYPNDPGSSQKYVNTICLSALRLLVYFASESDGFLSNKSSKSKSKQSSLKWGFKFFNSSHHYSRVGGHILRDFKLRYFEEFENDLERKFEESFSERNPEKTHVASDCLRKALMEIIYDFQWEKPDITSPVKFRRNSMVNRENVVSQNNNLVFVFSRFPENPSSLRKFAGKRVIDADICLDLFMPQSLHREFHGLYQLQLFWIDCFGILTRPGVDPESIKLFEKTLNKIGGHLIPAEILVQLCEKYVSNIASVFPFEEFEHSKIGRNHQELASKQENCVTTSGKVPNSNKTDVRKSSVLRPVLPFIPIVSNLLSYCQNSRSRRSSTGGEDSKSSISLLTHTGKSFCDLEVVPMHKNERTDKLHGTDIQTPVGTNIREMDVGGDTVLSVETDIVRKSLLTNGGIECLRVCAMFVTQTWTQLDWTGLEQCVCTAVRSDKHRSIQFEQLLSHLHLQKSCLILEAKGHASLVILKPLTTVSASLSLLSVGRTLALEKTLYQDRDIDSHVRDLHREGGPSWPELITRLTDKQKISTCRPEPDQARACFDPKVVEKAYLPGCHQSFGRLLDKLNQRISQMDFLNQEEKRTLGELQRLYRYENQPPHTHSNSQPGLCSQDLTKEKTSTAQEEGKKGQGSLASRGEMMVTRSRQAVNQKGKDDSVSLDSRSKDKPNTDHLLSKADFADEGELMTYLQDVYSGAVCNGTPSLSVCCQTIITVALHYTKERCSSKPQEQCIKMLEQVIVLPLSGLREKYVNSSTDEEKQQKIREYQLQVLLRLESESVLSAGETPDMSEADDRVDQVVNLLRTLGFVTDPTALSEFMSTTILEMYVHTLPHTLGRIYDDLMQPLPSELEAILSPNNSADQSVFSQSLLKSDNPGSNMSGLTDTSISQPPSNQSDVLLNRPKRNARRHTLVHHPSLAEVGPKRQIMVKKVEKKREKKDRQSHKKSHNSKKKTKDPGSGEKVCRNLFESKKTKLERRQSVAVMENIGSRQHHSKRLPNLKSPKALKSPFKSPTFRNKKVSETPAHKQKCQAVFSRIEKERHRSRSVTSVQVVEESPVKASFQQRDSPSQRKRAMAMLRRSFYSAGPTKRSRNLVKYFQLTDRLEGRPPVNRLSLGASLHDLSAEFKSPDKNSSLIFSQLMGSPTPPKSTPNKMVVTPAKHLVESPSMHTRSKSPARLDGTPKKHVISKSLLESPCMNTRSKSPGFGLGRPKVLFGEGGPVVHEPSGGSLSQTPVKETSLVAESPSQNTRSKSTGTPNKRSSRAKMFLFKSPENKNSSLKSISTNISSSKCLNLSKFDSAERQIHEKDEHLAKDTTDSVINLSWLETNGSVGGICIKDPTAQSTPRQQNKKYLTKSSEEKTPSPRKQAGDVTTPSSSDKRPRKQKLQNLFQSPKTCKTMQSPQRSSEWQNLRQSPRLSSRTFNQTKSPTSDQTQGKSPRHYLSQKRSLCERLLSSPRSAFTDENLNRPCHSPSKLVTEDNGVSLHSDSGKQKSQECEAMDTDNESIFSELSQGFDNTTSVLSEISSPITRKRSLRLSPEASNVFSPSKRRRVQLHTLDTNKNLSTSYCLHNRVLSRQADSFGSNPASQGFSTETCMSQGSSLSQSSVNSDDYFSLSNDQVFLSRKPKVMEKSARSQSPVFGSAKKEKRSIVYSGRPHVVEDISSSVSVGRSQSPNVTRQAVSPSMSVSPRITRNDHSKSPYMPRKSQTPSRSALTKLSPSNRKYSPNVSAKSLMHLINSPLVTSPDGEEQRGQDSLCVKRKRPQAKSKRSLDLHT
ncbi:treslin-like [Argopecten irradians]|uniref:treslin-like n=1 Tax=Argopecten irradians TaxID=31199 RepID=UPI003716E437